jgi:hypothetical protein
MTGGPEMARAREGVRTSCEFNHYRDCSRWLGVLTFLLSAIFILSGCGMANAVSEPLPLAGQAPRASRQPEEIEIYKNGTTVQKGIIPIASIGSHGNGYANMATLEDAMRKKAAEIGADAVMVTKYEVTKDETVGSYSGGFFTSQQIQRPHLYGVAVVYSRVRMGLVCGEDGTIKYVNADSPADKAGLKEGMQIVAINGTYFANTSVLSREVGIKNPGDVVTVEYLDSSKEKKKVTITLQAN